MDCCGTSLVAQWLRLYASNKGMQVQSLGWELRSQMLPGQKKKNQNAKMNAVISERLGVTIEFLGDKLKFKKIPDI